MHTSSVSKSSSREGAVCLGCFANDLFLLWAMLFDSMYLFLLSAGKTDYRARIRLINQDKNKYNTPKYRFVVRFVSFLILSILCIDHLVLACYYDTLINGGIVSLNTLTLDQQGHHCTNCICKHCR
jgi:hypothetical protein